MSRPLLIYDESNRVIRRTAAALTCRRDIVPVGWGSDAVQTFLQAQFDYQPFAFVLVEENVVHVGDAAVKRLLERIGMVTPIVRTLTRAYPTAAPVVGRLIHGREPANLHGTFQLVEAARPTLSALRGHSVPVEQE